MSRTSLKLQLTLGAVILGIVLLLVQAAVQFHTLRKELTGRIEAHQFSLVSEVAANLDEKIEERLSALGRGATTVPLAPMADRGALERHLREESALLSLFDDLYIFDSAGMLLVDWPLKPGRRGLDMSSRDYIREVQKSLRPAISRPLVGKSTGQPMIVMAAPIVGRDGKLAGILGGVINLYQPNLLGNLPGRRIGESGYFYLVDADRTLISHPDRKRLLQPIAPPGANPVLDQAMEGFEGTREGTNSRGLHGLFTFKRLRTTGWILASVVPGEEAFRPIAAVQQQMLITTLLLILAVTPLLWLFVHYLLRPLGELAEALKKRALGIRPGTAVQPVAESGCHEMRTLAHAFNEFLAARNEAEGRQRLAARVFETTVEAVVITDPQATVLAVNPAFCRITGYSEEEILGRNLRILRSGRHDKAFIKAMWQTLLSNGQWTGEIWSRRKNGEDFPKWQTVSSVRDESGKITNHVFVFTDLSDIRRAEQAAEMLSWHDTLTGLANRPFFLLQVDKALGEARRHDAFASVLLLDLDRFKDINEARGLGHGDALLKLVAERLREVLYPEDLLARLDSDEFAILLPRLLGDREKAGRAALAVAEKVHRALRRNIELESEVFHLDASIGIAQLPESAQETAADVVRQADTAMHQAKAQGGGRSVFFEAAMGDAVRQRYQLEQELRSAAATDQLRLYLQPQVDHQGREIGAEALVRWEHPERGLVSPGVFIPLAEMSDLIVAVDRWMLAAVCRLLSRLERDGHPLRISVNISPRHFHRSDFVDEVKRQLADNGADPGRLVLEVTEGLLIDNVADAVAKMTLLNDLGVHFSLDDFGTGYSSLAHLKRLPIHEIKIDRSFIQDAPVDPNDAALVDTILAVAQHLHLQVVAEGVETRAHEDFLADRGEIFRQGYFHGRPMPVESWLARREANGTPAV